MNCKKLCSVFVVFLCFSHGVYAGFRAMFDTRNIAAINYQNSKKIVTKNVIRAIVGAATLGCFKYR